MLNSPKEIRRATRRVESTTVMNWMRLVVGTVASAGVVPSQGLPKVLVLTWGIGVGPSVSALNSTCRPHSALPDRRGRHRRPGPALLDRFPTTATAPVRP
jgi:hypothetical protein